MTKVQRYMSHYIAIDAGGEWVRYSDYAALELNEDALLKDNKYLRKQCDKFMGERDALAAENKRLRGMLREALAYLNDGEPHKRDCLRFLEEASDE